MRIVDATWLRQKYVDEGLSAEAIGNLINPKLSRACICKKLEAIGIKRRTKPNRTIYLDGQPCIISQGYVWFRMKDHPRSNNHLVKRCVLNLEKKLGRRLQDGEMVHHIDGNRMNDDPENLELTTRADHMKRHKPINKRWEKPRPEWMHHPIKDNKGHFTGKWLRDYFPSEHP